MPLADSVEGIGAPARLGMLHAGAPGPVQWWFAVPTVPIIHDSSAELSAEGAALPLNASSS
jgi:hypothetical protein